MAIFFAGIILLSTLTSDWGKRIGEFLTILGGYWTISYLVASMKDWKQELDDSVNPDAPYGGYHCPYCNHFLGHRIDDTDRGTTFKCPECRKEIKIPD